MCLVVLCGSVVACDASVFRAILCSTRVLEVWFVGVMVCCVMPCCGVVLCDEMQSSRTVILSYLWYCDA